MKPARDTPQICRCTLLHSMRRSLDSMTHSSNASTICRQRLLDASIASVHRLIESRLFHTQFNTHTTFRRQVSGVVVARWPATTSILHIRRLYTKKSWTSPTTRHMVYRRNMLFRLMLSKHTKDMTQTLSSPTTSTNNHDGPFTRIHSSNNGLTRPILCQIRYVFHTLWSDGA